jgi:hypothetical protein
MNLLRRLLAELLGPPAWAVEGTAAIAAWSRRRAAVAASLEELLAGRRPSSR